MTTALKLIEGSMRLIGALAEEEPLGPAAAQDALTAFNQMLDSWSTERLSVFCTQDQQFTWPANQRSRTLGPTGNFVGTRPVLLNDSTYYVGPNNLSFSPQFVNEDQYNAIALKSVTSTYPNVIFVNMTFPDITMFVYPVPIQALEWHFISVQELAQAANLSVDILLPKGYLRAFRFNLAVEIANEFGEEVMPSTKRIADNSKRNLKRINNPDDVMSMPYPLIANRSRFNIYTNQPQ